MSAHTFDPARAYLTIADDGLSGHFAGREIRILLAYYSLFHEQLAIADTFFLNSAAIQELMWPATTDDGMRPIALSDLLSAYHVVPALREEVASFRELLSYQIKRHGPTGYDLATADYLDSCIDVSAIPRWPESKAATRYRDNLIESFLSIDRRGRRRFGRLAEPLAEYTFAAAPVLRRDIRRMLRDPSPLTKYGLTAQEASVLITRHGTRVLRTAITHYASTLPTILGMYPILNIRLLPVKLYGYEETKLESEFDFIQIEPRWILNSEALASMPADVLRTVKGSQGRGPLPSHTRLMEYLRLRPFSSGASAEEFAAVLDPYLRDIEEVYQDALSPTRRATLCAARRKQIVVTSTRGVLGVIVAGLGVITHPVILGLGMAWAIGEAALSLRTALRRSRTPYLRTIGVISTDKDWLVGLNTLGTSRSSLPVA